MSSRAAAVMVAVAATAFLAFVLVAVGRGIAFGFDEAVYAQLAGHWVNGRPASGWDLHRPPLLSLLGTLPLLLGIEAEWAFRLFGVAAGIGTVLAAAVLARDAGGPLAGVIAAVTLAAASPLMIESSSFLTDVPATFALVGATFLAWRWGRSDGCDRTLPWLAIALAAAFYLRYGALIGIFAILLATGVVFRRVVTRQAGQVLRALALLAVLLLPHLVIATLETGAPWGIVLRARTAADDGSIPALSYGMWFWWDLLGPLGAGVGLVGIVAILRAMLHRGPRDAPEHRCLRFLALAIVPQVIVLGVFVHGEPRYALVPMTLLVVAGSAGIGHALSGEVPRPVRGAMVVAGAAALLLGGVLTVGEIDRRASAYDWTRDVGTAIGADASGMACSILTSDVPIMSWYSGCAAHTLVGGPPVERLALLDGSHRYLVERLDGLLQPPASDMERLRTGAQPWRAFPDGTAAPAAVVHRRLPP